MQHIAPCLFPQAPGVGVGMVPRCRHEQLGAGDRGQQRPLLLPHQARDGGVAGVPGDSGPELKTETLGYNYKIGLNDESVSENHNHHNLPF